MDHLLLSVRTIILFFLISIINKKLKLIGQVDGSDFIHNNIKQKQCSYTTHESLYQVTCNNLCLTTIPQNLETNIEVGF